MTCSDPTRRVSPIEFVSPLRSNTTDDGFVKPFRTEDFSDGFVKPFLPKNRPFFWNLSDGFVNLFRQKILQVWSVLTIKNAESIEKKDVILVLVVNTSARYLDKKV